jgi:hypothetical protein
VSKTPTKSASKKKPVDDEAEESTPKKGKKGGDKGKGKKKKSKASDMLSSDEDEGDDDESSSSSDDGDGDSSGDDDEDGGAPDVMEKMVVEREGDEVTSNLPVNIHPLNAQSMVQQLFARDRELMTLMYGTMTSSGVLKADPCMFFLQTLPVPPNRFRSPQPSTLNPCMFSLQTLPVPPNRFRSPNPLNPNNQFPEAWTLDPRSPASNFHSFLKA